MNIHWENLIAAILALGALALLVRYRHAVAAFLSGIERVGPGFNPDEQAMGLIAFGIIGAILVAIVKILTQKRDK